MFKNQETLLNITAIVFTALASDKNSSHDPKIMKKDFRDNQEKEGHDNCKKMIYKKSSSPSSFSTLISPTSDSFKS